MSSQTSFNEIPPRVGAPPEPTRGTYDYYIWEAQYCPKRMTPWTAEVKAEHKRRLEANAKADAHNAKVDAAMEAFKYSAVDGTDFDYVIGALNESTEGWFPRGDYHLVGGPSGSSKSTLVIDLLESQLKKEPFLGHATYGLSYLIVMPDRGVRAHNRTCRRMRIDPKTIPIEFISSLMDKAAALAIKNIIETCVDKRGYMPAVVFIEGADLLSSNASKMEIVTPFVDRLRKIAEHYHISLICSVGAPKARDGEGYTAKRDNIFGTVAWSRKAETVCNLQYIKSDDMDIRRALSVQLRNGSAEKYQMEIKNGRLIESAKTEGTDNDPDVAWFKKQTDWFSVYDFMKGRSISHSAAYRCVSSYYTKGQLRLKSGPKTKTKTGPKKGPKGVNLYLWTPNHTEPIVQEHPGAVSSLPF